jgi:endonuclease-3 related protein
MNSFEKLYKELKKKYGNPGGQWSLWCKRPKTEQEREEVVMEAILTQRTNWKNVELTLNNLKKAKIDSLKKIYQLNPRKLESFIKPSGFYKAKAGYLFNLVRFIIENYGGLKTMKKEASKKLRKELLKLKGIGPETADSILLYALDKPIFVIDEYTRRLVLKFNLAESTDYQSLQKLFEDNLKRDFRLYQDFHALIVIDGKNSVC